MDQIQLGYHHFAISEADQRWGKWISQMWETKIRPSDFCSTSSKNLYPSWVYSVSHQVIAEDVFNSYYCVGYSSFPAYLPNPVDASWFIPIFYLWEYDSERRMDSTVSTQRFLRENSVMQRTLHLEPRVESEICQPKGYRYLEQSCTSGSVLSSVKWW